MARITQANAKAERVLTLRELNRALLERQLLLGRRRLAAPGAIERLCALQAQYSLSPYIALWSRVTGFRKEQLTRALERGTTPRNPGAWLAAIARTAERESDGALSLRG